MFDEWRPPGFIRQLVTYEQIILTFKRLATTVDSQTLLSVDQGHELDFDFDY